jgi:hypothetical protein
LVEKDLSKESEASWWRIPAFASPSLIRKEEEYLEQTDIDALEENTHCCYYISVQLPTQSLAPILLYECLRRPHSAFLQYLDHPAALTEL